VRFPGRRTSLLVLGCWLAFAQPAVAQVIRGTITDRVTGLPLAGVLVSVQDPRDSSAVVIRNALTTERGEYAITLPRPGSWRLTAKRIGVARYVSPAFEIDPGETRRLDVVLDPVAAGLPAMQVTGTTLCLTNRDQLRSIVALWDEIRTALIATEISQRERRVVGWLSRYSRLLDPRTLRIFEEQRSVAEGRYESPIRSISGDSLAAFGFWGAIGGDTLVFYAPDAEALLSTAFQDGHCFLMVSGTGTTRGMVGMAFRPRVRRVTGGAEGTIWIDASSFELRFVELRYTNLVTVPRNPHLGSEVHFLRDPSGAWMVNRWFVRMPVFPEVTSVAQERDGRAPRHVATVHRILEEGGSLFAPGLQSWAKPGTIEGVVQDSTARRPLAGSRVSLGGTPYSVEVDARGGFRFDSIPPGAYSLLVSHESYALLGQLVDDEPLTLAPGQTYRSRLRGRTTKELLVGLCEGRMVVPGEATLRVQAVHADSGGPVPRLRLWLRWRDPLRRTTLPPAGVNPASAGALLMSMSVGLVGLESMTNASGVAAFCGVPPMTSLELVMLRSDDEVTPYGARVVRVGQWSLNPGEIGARTIAVRPPR
jgi:hypothetical protein